MCLLRKTKLLAVFLYALLACNRLPRAFSRACIALSALAPDGQTPSVTKAPVTTDVAQTSYVLGNLPPKLTFDYAIAVDDLRYLTKLIFAELVGLGALVDPGFFQYLSRRALAYADDVSQRNQYRLVVGNINTDYTRHISSFSFLVSCFMLVLSDKNYPWRCLCRGSVQITRTTPLRRTILQFSHIRFTELLTFIHNTCSCGYCSQPNTAASGD
jgi:hypothetical protein